MASEIFVTCILSSIFPRLSLIAWIVTNNLSAVSFIVRPWLLNNRTSFSMRVSLILGSFFQNFFDLAKFIVKENHIHHLSSSYRETDFLDEIIALYMEDLSVYDNSVFYVAYDGSCIVGSVKVTLWAKQIILPIEKLFGLKVESIFLNSGFSNIWHVGRFAISKSNGMLLLKKLLIMAISTICTEVDSLMIAECDKKFVKVLNLMGIKTALLGSSVFYLGSETLPVYSTYEWLNNFLIQAAGIVFG